MTLCYYITGHGFGHAIRTAQILKAFPADIPLILKTTVPERLFREEAAGRSFRYIPAEYDCGCLQSDSVTVMPRATLDRYSVVSAANEDRLADEVAFLKREGVRAIVTDIPAFPLRAAREADIPGFAVANFTWHDIYQDYAGTPEDRMLLTRMAAEYAAATCAFITPLSTATAAVPFRHVLRVPLIARQGQSVRARMRDTLGVGEGRNIALLYLGTWGVEIDWSALEIHTDWIFLTYDTPPRMVSNIRTLNRTEWPYADVAASVEAVISKAGYGTVTECIANSVPLVYVPRSAFAEYDALVDGMKPWGGGVPIADTDFRSGRWQDALAAACAAKMNPGAYATDGAAVVAGELLSYLP